MDRNSKEQNQQHSFPYLLSYPSITLFTPNSHTMAFNVLRDNTNRTNSNIFVPIKGYADVHPTEKQIYSVENYSESDSSSDVDGDDGASDEEASLEELLLHDGKVKEKIELLAAMVGVDTKEPPVVVLTEVVRILKNFKRSINQFPTTITN